MATDHQMTTRTAPEIFQGLAAAAEARSISVPALASEILTQWVLSNGLLAKDDEARLEAERELLEWVTALVERRHKADDWDKHVTLETFDAIKAEQAGLYARAIKGGRKTKLNREIGALVRRGLNADVKVVGDLRCYGQPLRGAKSLVKTYTLLFRPSET